MPKSKKKKNKAARYVRRLAEDEHVQHHVRDAATGLRGAYDRVARHGGKAVEDKKLDDVLRGAATSTRKAGLALQRGERKPKRRGRVVIPLAASAATVAVISRGRREKPDDTAPSDADDLSTA
jgi:hypothetical protein